MMPDALKIAELLPALEKPDADFTNNSDCRPIFNLKVVSKVIEKAVTVQLTTYVSTQHLDEFFQPDILCASYSNHSVILFIILFCYLDYQTDLVRCQWCGPCLIWVVSKIS